MVPKVTKTGRNVPILPKKEAFSKKKRKREASGRNGKERPLAGIVLYAGLSPVHPRAFYLDVSVVQP